MPLPFVCGAQSPLLSWRRAMSSSSAVLWFRYRLGGTAHTTSWPLSCLPQIYRPSMTGRRAGTPIHRDNTHTHSAYRHTHSCWSLETHTNSSHTFGPTDTEWLISVLKYTHKCLNIQTQTHLDWHKIIINISKHAHSQMNMRTCRIYNICCKDPWFGHTSNFFYLIFLSPGNFFIVIWDAAMQI